jgi:hypothetical protein
VKIERRIVLRGSEKVLSHSFPGKERKMRRVIEMIIPF